MAEGVDLYASFVGAEVVAEGALEAEVAIEAVAVGVEELRGEDALASLEGVAVVAGEAISIVWGVGEAEGVGWLAAVGGVEVVAEGAGRAD